MNCSDCQDLLSEYIDGDLVDSRRSKVSAHLKSCPECHLIHEDLVQIVRASQELPLAAQENILWQGFEKEIKELTNSPRYHQPSTWQRFWGYRLQFSLSLAQLAGGMIGLALLIVVASSL